MSQNKIKNISKIIKLLKQEIKQFENPIATEIGEKTKDPLSMYMEDIFTVPANIGAIPAVSIPSGFVERDGNPSTGGGRVRLPLGFQIMAGYGHDKLLYELGKRFESYEPISLIMA